MIFAPSAFGKKIMPLLAVFTLINIVFIAFENFWKSINITAAIVLLGNALLFLLSILSIWLHLKASHNKNPNVLVRSIMGSTLLKMIIIGATVIWYTKFYAAAKSKISVIIIMVAYLLYTFLEVRIALKINKSK